MLQDRILSKLSFYMRSYVAIQNLKELDSEVHSGSRSCQTLKIFQTLKARIWTS